MRQLGRTEANEGNGSRVAREALLPLYAATKAGISTSLEVSLTVPIEGSNGRPACGVPAIFLTAKSELADKLKGLTMGADDYLTKPFQMLELTARVEAVLRRTKKAETEFTLGSMKCDFDRHQIFLDGVVVECTPKEYELLEVLVRNRNIALSRERLLDMVWGYDFDGGTRTVDVHIQRLRHKFHLEDHIKTVYKLGYRLEVLE